jgi:hypothetical protein
MSCIPALPQHVTPFVFVHKLDDEDMSSDKQLRYRNRGPGACTEMFRALLILVNFVLALGSLAVVGMVAYLMAIHTKHINDVCSTCENLFIFALVLFCTLFVFSMIGLCALLKRNLCLLLVYGFYLLIFFLAALAITVIFILIKTGKFDGTMQGAWNDMSLHGTGNLCGLQIDAKCSGWYELCSNDTYSFNNTEACPVCTEEQQSQIQNFTETCYTELSRVIDQYYNPIVITGFTLVGVSLLSIIVSCRVRKNHEDDDDGGSYTRM